MAHQLSEGPEEDLELTKDHLFICYATILQEWYSNPKAVTNVDSGVHAWITDFCGAHEIDPNTKFIAQSRNNLRRLVWQALLADIAILPQTQSFEAVKLGMKMPPMTPGITKPEEKG